MHPDNYTSALVGETDLYVIHVCPICERGFVGHYSGYIDGISSPFSLVDVYPKNRKLSDFSAEIQELSPQFCNIYEQSQSAEQAGLTEICGLGYRKAVEFLVKDYAAYKSPGEKGKIQVEWLSATIKQRIDNGSIKVLAERATWIGNDEAHYLRKFEELDVQNMKHFINAMTTFIDAEIAVQEALEILPRK